MSDSRQEEEMAGMIDKIKSLETDVPSWDVALASLVEEESEKLGQGLRLADFQRLAADHAIRFDDIMATVFEMVIQGVWEYQSADGEACAISRDEVEKLYVGGRMVEADLNQYAGLWLPK